MSLDTIETFQNFVAGSREHAETMPGINPATGCQIARRPKSNRACANRAVAAAVAAQAGWAARSVFDRAAMALRAAGYIRESSNRLTGTSRIMAA